MKTLLLGTPVYNKTKYGRRFFRPYAPPIGLAYIASMLKREGFRTRVVDMINYGWKDVELLIRSEEPDVIGIGCFTEQRQSTFILADIIKSINRNIKVIVGGVHASFMYKQILKNFSSIDIIVIGEGEETFLELIKVLDAGEKLGSIKGIAYRKKEEIIKTGERPQISDLNTLPFPDFDDFSYSSYKVYSPIRSFNIRGRERGFVKYMSVNTSRGCIGKCQFCSVHRFWRSSWRSRSPSNVVDEIEILNKEKGIRFVNFTDDIFTIREDRIIEMCKEILKRNIEIIWDCETRPDFISRDMLCWMKKAGCISIAFGIESGSPLILNTINKETGVDKIKKSIYLTKDEGIKVNLLLMVGNPGESDETVDETIKLVKELKPDIRTVQITNVYPGTPLYDLCKSTGMVNDDYWLTDKPAPFYTKEATLIQLKMWQDRLLIGTSPSNIEKVLRRMQSFIDRNIGIRISFHGIEKGKNI